MFNRFLLAATASALAICAATPAEAVLFDTPGNYQFFTPVAGQYVITVAGGAGGGVTTTGDTPLHVAGGLGAVVGGVTVSLPVGAVFGVTVGSAGQSVQGNFAGAGGGAASLLFFTPLQNGPLSLAMFAMAGGGGGAGNPGNGSYDLGPISGGNAFASTQTNAGGAAGTGNGGGGGQGWRANAGQSAAGPNGGGGGGTGSANGGGGAYPGGNGGGIGPNSFLGGGGGGSSGGFYGGGGGGSGWRGGNGGNGGGNYGTGGGGGYSYVGNYFATRYNNAGLKFLLLSTFGFVGNVGDGYVRIELVPEPATLGLFGLSLAGLGLARRRGRQ